MKITGNEPAYPALDSNSHDGIVCLELRYEGLTIRQQFAMAANPDIDGFKEAAIESIMGRPLPSISEYIETFVYFAEFKAKLKVIEANALIAELNRTEQ